MVRFGGERTSFRDWNLQTKLQTNYPKRSAKKVLACPLLALSGDCLLALVTSAFAQQADISGRLPDVR
jgi:hypothetical protein